MDIINIMSVKLQIWLRERLALLDVPRSLNLYTPRQLMSRCLSRVATSRTDTDWDAFLRNRQDNDIRWQCPWWSLSEVTIELFGHCVPLAGLHYSNFYTPSRLCRHYGKIERIVLVLPDFETSPLHPRFLDQISQT